MGNIFGYIRVSSRDQNEDRQLIALKELASSLADLYDPLTMPPELLKAHNANNRAVMEAYGFSTKMSEADCVAELMKMYQKLTEEK